MATDEAKPDEQPECGRCNSPMVVKKAPFYVRGEYVGAFDSIVCEFCNFTLLTSSGYDKAMTEARKFGLVGPEEDIMTESIEEGESSYTLEEKVTSSNIYSPIEVFSISGEKNEGQAQSGSGNLPTITVFKKREPLIVTQIVAFKKPE